MSLFCPEQLQCQYDTVLGKSYCGCIENCSYSSNDKVCGTDQITYDSRCSLDKAMCEMFGTDINSWNVSVAYESGCGM